MPALQDITRESRIFLYLRLLRIEKKDTIRNIVIRGGKTCVLEDGGNENE